MTVVIYGEVDDANRIIYDNDMMTYKDNMAPPREASIAKFEILLSKFGQFWVILAVLGRPGTLPESLWGFFWRMTSGLFRGWPVLGRNRGRPGAPGERQETPGATNKRPKSP